VSRSRLSRFALLRGRSSDHVKASDSSSRWPAFLVSSLAGIVLLVGLFAPSLASAANLTVTGGGNGAGSITAVNQLLGAPVAWGSGGPTTCSITAGVTSPASCIGSPTPGIGAVVQLTATPAPGFSFSGWEVVSGTTGGSCLGTLTYGVGDLELACATAKLASAATIRANFTSTLVAPAAVTGSATPAIYSAKLEASVNPNGSAVTSCRFEYGPTESYGYREPCSQTKAAVGSGASLVSVNALVGPLRPGTIYHYRFVARNASSGGKGEDRTFATAAAVDPCTNAARRDEQGAGALILPDCRAYELVSNGDSHGGPVLLEEGSSPSTIGHAYAVAEDGDRALFTATTFGQPNSLPSVYNPTVAMRGASGWETVPMAPDPAHAANYALESSYGVTSDLSAALWDKQAPGQQVRGELQWRLSHLDGSLTNASPLIVPQLLSGNLLTGSYTEPWRSIAGSADLSRFVFGKGPGSGLFTVALLPGETPPALNASNLYEITGASTSSPSLSLVNREGVGGAQIGGACGAYVGGYPIGPVSTAQTHAMSADGSIIYFSARPGTPAEGSCGTGFPVRIFKRVNEGKPFEVDASQCNRVVPACVASGDDKYLGASDDGSTVFFNSARQLADTDTDTTEDLYAYDALARNDVQRLTVNATAGSFTLTATTGIGTGTTVNGSKEVTGVGTAVGAFHIGDSIALAGATLPATDTIETVDSVNHRLILTEPVSAGAGADQTINATETTGSIQFNAEAAGGTGAIQEKLAALAGIGTGNVALTGGGLGLFSIEFKGAPFAEKPVPQLKVTSSLTGTAVVEPSVEGGHLTQLSAGETTGGHVVGSGAETQGVVDTAADGSRAYFVAKGALTGTNVRGLAPVAGKNNLYVYQRDALHPAGRLAFVGELLATETEAWAPTSANASKRVFHALPSRETTSEGHRIAGNGRFLVFTAAAKLLAEDTDSQPDLYRYDDNSGQLLCLSCAGEAGAGKGNEAFPVQIFPQSGGSPADYSEITPVASEDVSRVVFDTQERLLPAVDTNVAFDAYEWSEAKGLFLISGATGEVGIAQDRNRGTYAPAISADGRNVFFATEVPLLGSDRDFVTDLYDARTEGGIAELAAVPPCEGESACRVPYSHPPAEAPPGTSRHLDSGNLAAPKACRKNQVRRGGKCVKKLRRPKKRHHGGRASRKAGGVK
jgi:hypothetical protein